MCKFSCKYAVHSTVLLTRVAVKCMLDSVFTCNWMAFTDLATWMWSFKHLLPDTVTSIFWDNRCCIIVCTFRIQFNGCICKKKKKSLCNQRQQNQPDLYGLSVFICLSVQVKEGTDRIKSLLLSFSVSFHFSSFFSLGLYDRSVWKHGVFKYFWKNFILK